MPLVITHKRVSAQPDDPTQPDLIQPSNWNDTHALAGALVPGDIDGFGAAAAAAAPVQSVVGQTGAVTGAQILAATVGTAASDPTASNDSTQGYAAGSRWINTTTSLIWVCLSASVGAAVWLPAGIAPHPGFVAGLHYPLSQNSTQTAAVAAADTLYLFPFLLPSSVTITALFGRVTTGGAGSSMKLAIWASRSGRPSGLPVIANNAGISTAAAGMASASVSATLNPGWYWAGTKFTGTLPAMTMILGSSQMAWLSGTPSQGTTMPATVSGISTPDAYANDISAKNMTGATFTTVVSTIVPALGMSL